MGETEEEAENVQQKEKGMTHVYFVHERKLHFRPTKTYVNKIMFHADRPTKVRSKKKEEGGIETAVANERKCLYGSHKDGQIHHASTQTHNGQGKEGGSPPGLLKRTDGLAWTAGWMESYAYLYSNNRFLTNRFPQLTGLSSYKKKQKNNVFMTSINKSESDGGAEREGEKKKKIVSTSFLDPLPKPDMCTLLF
ncbi:hypothetical protein OUZ56_000156 [Daphnia magna]|uniref:Uncharacterized protein n=1 Tax=Daphnia magna TaxID=35525 RepID=A0ABQ9ZYV3_9CRUS|nr:hypothetical protein OUZ56_000156 [Daphnia magna]